jgi:hypothetical protein
MATLEIMVGADIGQRVDPTAIAVVELEWRGGTTAGVHDHYVCRHIGRLAIGTPYPEVAAELVRITNAIRARVIRTEQHVGVGSGQAGVFVREEHPEVTLYIDATGVGQPLVDLLEAAGVSPTACYFSFGERRTEIGNSEIKLGKAWMVGRLQVLAQSGRLHLPQTSEAEAARKELLSYEIRVSDEGRDSFGAFGGRHDDLVTALGLATQPPPGRTEFYGLGRIFSS